MKRLIAATAACVTMLGLAAAPVSAAPEQDGVVDRLESIPGLTVVGERPTEEGYRFFDLTFTQPADHHQPDGATFEQRLTLLHKDFARPNVMYTSGYYVPEQPHRAEPTQLVAGNQLNMEYRFFEPSRPEPADWTTLDIWQAATDQHRVVEAFRKVYGEEWITTGGSKGGMTATYHRRFYPQDVDGTVAYVAPNDVDNEEDSRYDEFFATVGNAECRDKLAAVQREVLVRRDEMLQRYRDYAERNGLTFERLPGGIDQALEGTVLDTVFAFWQYQLESDCTTVPSADASTQELWDFVDNAAGWGSFADSGLDYYVPYYFQAATELGWPDVSHEHLDDLLRHDHNGGPAQYVPDGLPVEFDHKAMADIDRWVRTRGSELLYVNGENDPWAAEPFEVSPAPTKDSAVFTVPGGNHGSNIAKLPQDERDQARAMVLEWAGVSDDPTVSGGPTYIPALDDYEMPRHPL